MMLHPGGALRGDQRACALGLDTRGPVAGRGQSQQDGVIILGDAAPFRVVGVDEDQWTHARRIGSISRASESAIIATN